MLLLQFAYGFRLPGFQVDEEAISGVLNFNGLRYHCVIPWEAVFALTAPEFGHEGHFWPEDVPPEMMENLEEEEGASAPTPAPAPAPEPPRKGPVLSVVKEAPELDESEGEELNISVESVTEENDENISTGEERDIEMVNAEKDDDIEMESIEVHTEKEYYDPRLYRLNNNLETEIPILVECNVVVGNLSIGIPCQKMKENSWKNLLVSTRSWKQIVGNN